MGRGVTMIPHINELKKELAETNCRAEKLSAEIERIQTDAQSTKLSKKYMDRIFLDTENFSVHVVTGPYVESDKLLLCETFVFVRANADGPYVISTTSCQTAKRLSKECREITLADLNGFSSMCVELRRGYESDIEMVTQAYIENFEDVFIGKWQTRNRRVKIDKRN